MQLKASNGRHTAPSDTSFEVARVAFEMGYYASPRRCTVRDIANKVGLSHTAVNVHILRVHNALVERLFHPDRTALQLRIEDVKAELQTHRQRLKSDTSQMERLVQRLENDLRVGTAPVAEVKTELKFHRTRMERDGDYLEQLVRRLESDLRMGGGPT